MLDKQVQQPHLVRPDLRQLLDDGVGDEVGAAGARGEAELFLGPHRVTCLVDDVAVLVRVGGEDQAQREGPEEVEEGWEEGEDY